MVQITITDKYIPNYLRNTLSSTKLYIQMQSYERMNQKFVSSALKIISIFLLTVIFLAVTSKENR